MTDSLVAIPILRHGDLWFEMTSEAPGPLPPFLGSTLRGGLMAALRGIACVFRGRPPCAPCDFRNTCTCALLFETPRPSWAERLPKMETVVHPLVIEPPDEPLPVIQGSLLAFRVRLFGRAIDAAPFLIAAARRMGEIGLGRGRIPFRLQSVRDGGPMGPVLFLPDQGMTRTRLIEREASMSPADPPFRTDEVVLVQFRTSTRLRQNGRLLEMPTLGALVRSIAFRAKVLGYFYHGIDWQPDHGALDSARALVKQVWAEGRMVRLDRLSTRQNQKVPLDGFVGTIALTGVEGLTRLWPLMHLGEVLHVGKGTVFGLGKYCLERTG